MQRSTDQTNAPPSSELDGAGASRQLAGRPRLEVVRQVSPLSDAERRQREDAVRFANASIGLEGFKVSAQAQARADRFVAGEIDLAEFLSGK